MHRLDQQVHQLSGDQLAGEVEHDPGATVTVTQERNRVTIDRSDEKILLHATYAAVCTRRANAR
ncbi:MAG TPA: hypothetical protein VFM55_02410 [Micromonosporaceae bacterium]|nr:hypothetical protein [Micromonosporaceae bacterium]